VRSQAEVVVRAEEQDAAAAEQDGGPLLRFDDSETSLQAGVADVLEVGGQRVFNPGSRLLDLFKTGSWRFETAARVRASLGFR
jgi:hypothetical protein